MEQFISDNSMDGSDDDSSESHPKGTREVFLLVSHSIILFIGLPGNCLILRVYWTKTSKTSTNVLIMVLALADASVCLLRIVDIIEVVFAVEIPWGIEILESVGISSSVMITAAIAADRYDCICRPHKRFFTTKRSKITALFILVTSLIINIPNIINGFNDMKYEVVDTISLVILFASFVAAFGMITLCYTKVYITIRQHVKVNVASPQSTNNGLRPKETGTETCQHLEGTDMSVNDLGNSSVINSLSVSHAAKTNTSPISYIDMDHASTAAASKAPPKHQETNPEPSTQESGLPSHQGTGENKQEWAITSDARVRKGRVPNVRSTSLHRKTTNMLFVTSLVFLLTWIPNWISIGISFAAEGGINPLFADTWDALSSILYYVNNAINPVIYGLLNRRFRKDCKETLRKMKVCGCRRGGRQ
ncbi:D(2) dopamine receptor-like [Asterias amurensis]|uniref:D(2) dopamine receptor-like n=1 Tax=Asterias amurensis TaxID=7602 RepID=UPI003AB7888F